MTDDDLGELAEALDDACRENGKVSALRAGYFNDGAWCPLGALIGNDRRKLPSRDIASESLGLPWIIACAFIEGFDGELPGQITYVRPDAARAFELGRLFRELYP